MKKHQVILILDESFTKDLLKLSRQHHMWICESEHNTPRIKTVWEKEGRGYSQESGITSFKLVGNRLETFYSVLGTIDGHHGGDGVGLERWSQIEVFGLQFEGVDRERIAREVQCECELINRNDSSFLIRRKYHDAQ